MTLLSDGRISEFRSAFRGVLLGEQDPDYEEARHVHNGLVDRHPAVICRCRNTSDVVDAVRFAREEGIEVAVRGGGHNVSGRAVCDGGMMIDLSPMKAVMVDPVARVARAQPGVTWNEFNRETQLHGLATTGGVVSSTGISGLTLGGGLGWLMGQYGMAVDNLIAAEIVTANGEVLRASEDQNPDLFWGIRGGGGNFGVATAFEYRLHQVGPMVNGGLAAFTLDQAASVIRAYRDYTQSIPDELTMFVALTHAPDGSGLPLCAVLMCHTGNQAAADEAIEAVRGFGDPVMVELGPVPYSALNAMLDEGFPRGALNYWKAQFLTSMPDEAIDAMVQAFEVCPSPMSVMAVEHFHGEVTRVPVEATAYPHRQPGYNVIIAGQWTDPAESDRHRQWVRDTYAALEPYLANARYVNYLAEDEGEELANAYGPVLDRLRQVKAQYDPDNVFHHNMNITPAGS